MIVTTTNSVEGRRITDYKGVVVGEAIMGANVNKALRPRGTRRFVLPWQPGRLARVDCGTKDSGCLARAVLRRRGEPLCRLPRQTCRGILGSVETVEQLRHNSGEQEELRCVVITRKATFFLIWDRESCKSQADSGKFIGGELDGQRQRPACVPLFTSH